MEGSPGPSDLRKQLKEREAEVGILRDRLRESQEEIDRLRRVDAGSCQGSPHREPLSAVR